MKKTIVIIGLIVSFMITGCTKNEEPREEVTTIVYCDSCSEESKEVTKFCSNCGEEAKWLSEKPKKIQEEDDKDEENSEELIQEGDESKPKTELTSKEKETIVNKEYKTCQMCGEKFDKDINGYCSEQCYKTAANTKADGYYDNRCKVEGCSYQMSEEEMKDRDGYCEECWVYNAPEGTFGCFTGNDDVCNGCYYYGVYCLDNK